MLHPAIRAACLLLFCAPIWAAQVNVEASESFYSVDGTSTRELSAAMNREGPSAADGTRYAGEARWLIQYEFKLTEDNSGCTAGPALVTVKTHILLPRWEYVSSAPGDLQYRWDNMLRVLKYHEQGHKQHGVDAAYKLGRALDAMGTLPDCDAVKRRSTELYERMVEEGHKIDAEYDRVWRHGIDQGIKFR